jgi:hypothetical protein
MATWEIRGIFGNEYAQREAVEELKKQSGFELVVMDRRNISVRFPRRDEKAEGIVRRTVDIFHGWIESEAPLGKFDAEKAEERRKKLEKEARKRAAKAAKKAG